MPAISEMAIEIVETDDLVTVRIDHGAAPILVKFTRDEYDNLVRCAGLEHVTIEEWITRAANKAARETMDVPTLPQGGN